MLDKIFSKKYNVEEKKKFLQDECGIVLTEAENAEVENMCNYSDYIEQAGIAIGEARGEKRGEARGEARGKQQRLLQDVRSLMETLNLSAEKAMQALKVSPEEQAELLAQL